MAELSKIAGGLGGAGQGAAIGSTFGPVGTAFGAVLGGLSGFLGGGGEKKAKRLANEQAKVLELTAAENKRRATLEMGQVVGGARAQVFGSNLMMSGSSRNYVNQLKSQFEQDMEWEQVKSRMEAKQVRAGGSLAASQIRSSAISSMLGGLGSAATAGVFSKKTTPNG